MELIVAKDYEEMSLIAAKYIAEVIQEKYDATIGLTTGNTPIGLYDVLTDWYRSGKIDLGGIKVVSVEEYLGLSPEDPRSLYAWLRRVFIEPCAISIDRVLRIEAEDPEPQLACYKFDEAIEAMGGIDLLVEGIGTNGHIGFNEPGSLPTSNTRIVALREETMKYNFAYWQDAVPKHGMTIGLSKIMSARRVLLLASGSQKAQSLYRALFGPVTSNVPASYLQHVPRLTVVADQEAAALLPNVKRKVDGDESVNCRA